MFYAGEVKRGILMAACVLSQRVPWLPCLRGLRRNFTRTQHLCCIRKEETDDQETKRGAFEPQETSFWQGYKLYYSPSSYQHFIRDTATSLNQMDNNEYGQCVSTLAPSIWQQNNCYSVSCSRHLSSAKNTLLNVTLTKDSESEVPSVSRFRNFIPPEVKVDPRGFHKCRPQYADMSLDLTQKHRRIEWVEALPLLEKVGHLKGSMTPSDVCDFLVDLSHLNPGNMSLLNRNRLFTMLLRYSVENLRLFTDLQLLEVLQSFVWLGIPSTHTVLGLYETELRRRTKQMPLQQLLLAADVWRCIRRPVPEFLLHLYELIPGFFEKLGVSEFVQLLYIVGEGRHYPDNLIHLIEQLLMRNLSQLYPEEVGIVCLSLFKSKIQLPQSTVMCLVDQAHSVVKGMSNFAMVNVLKYLRFSYLTHKEWMEAMSTEVPLRVPEMGVQGLMHVALACSSMHYRSDNILNAIAEKVPTLVPQCRSKDACKLLWAFGTLRFLPGKCPNLYPSLIEALRNTKVEFQQYPHHLLSGLLGLAFMSIFPEDMIALALSPGFVKLALNAEHMDLKKDLLTLDQVVSLELPQWTGPRLSRELKEEVDELLWKYAQSDVCWKPAVLEAESALQELLGGQKFVCKRMILPHTRSIDLEVHLDSAGQPIPVNSMSHATKSFPRNRRVTLTEDLIAQLTDMKSTSSPSVTLSPKPTTHHRVEPVKEKPFYTGLDLTSDLIETRTKSSNPCPAACDAKGLVKLAIQVPSKNHYIAHSQQLLGLHAMKRRHLKLAGYRVVELSYHEWFPMLRKSRAEKLSYLRCKIYNSL